MIRVTLYGLTGKEKLVLDLEADEKRVLEVRPVFTVTRIDIAPVEVQETLGV